MFFTLFSQPTLFIIWVLAVVYGITVHEFSHVLAAHLLGDDTGKRLGRLTLNPLAHVDLFGFLLLMFVGFGWGKPAPYNPYNLKNRKWGEVLISLAGPASNLVSIVIFGLAANMLSELFLPGNLLIEFLVLLVLINIVLFVFNLIPIPPLDGSKLLYALLPDRLNSFKVRLAQNGPWVLLILLVVDGFLNVGIFSGLFQFFFELANTFLS